MLMIAGASDSPISQKRNEREIRGRGGKWVKQKEGRAGKCCGKGWARGSGSD